jgi:SagB-type dehydrogenase family enzyme
MTLPLVSQLLWAAQGVTDRRGFRTAPSAGALYPLEMLLVVGEVDGLQSGVYRYVPSRHALVSVVAGDVREALARAALGQSWVLRAPLSLVIAAVSDRVTSRYGHRGHQYVHFEVGHVAQNVYLQAVALGLATVAVGAFSDDGVSAACQLDQGEKPMYLLPVGRQRELAISLP